MLCVANLLYDTLVVEISVCVFPKAPFILSITDESKCSHNV